MDWKSKKRPLMGLVGAIGLSVIALGILGGFYPVMPAIAVGFVIWIVGATLVQVLTE